MGCFAPERPGESDAPDIAYGTGGGDRRRDRTVRGGATGRASRRPTGYDDSGTDSVPLIATYTTDTARTAPLTPRGAERGQALHAIDGLALKADKKRTADFWADLTAPRSRSGAGLKKLWLDRKVRATLDRSTQQVGADRAWAAGYDGTGTKVAVLDTGADARHPDLDGRITASENFTDSATTDDHQGHGTHVASTVGGSGTASGGKNKGWPPAPTSWWARSSQIGKFSLVGGPALHPRPATTGSVNLDGTGRAEVVDAGAGTPAELEAAGAEGRIALVKVADGASNVLAQARAAEEAGATALLVHRPSAGDWQPGIGYGAAPLPVLALRADEAAVLTGALGKGKAEVSWRATAVSPYVYKLSFPETRPVTSDRTCKVRDRKLGSVVSSHESMGVAADFVDTLLVSRPHGGTFGASNLDVVAAPGKRTEYCTAGDTVWQKMLSSSFPGAS